MLKQVAEGIFTRESTFVQFNSTVVQGRDGVLLIDPGVLETELVGLADDFLVLDQRVVAGISTHPHWDHLLWHSRFGEAPLLMTRESGHRRRSPGYLLCMRGNCSGSPKNESIARPVRDTQHKWLTKFRDKIRLIQ